MRYLITFAGYGTHLHGEPGAVDRNHNLPGTPLADISPARVEIKRQQMKQAPYILDKSRRQTALAAICEGCQHRNRKLWAAHIRTNHVHIVIEADESPETIMNALKSYASCDLNKIQIDDAARKRWARHGSARWLNSDQATQEAIRYVTQKQREPMELYLAELL
jgi:REP element-mobilizing transposase RayT